MRAVVLLILASGCTLYFGEPTEHHEPAPVDAGAAPTPDAPASCPKPGTHAEITYPPNGATNIAVPVPISSHVVIPNTLDGKGIYLSDSAGQAVSLDHYDASCSTQISNTGTPGTQDEAWTECYRDLLPNSTYTWHIWITCYDASGPHEIATSTFRTAP